MKRLTKLFASGLMFTLPMAITTLALLYVYDKVARLLREPFVAIYKMICINGVSIYELLPKHILAILAEALTVVILFFVLVLIGWLVKRMLSQCKDNAIHRFLENIPVVKTIFKPVNQAVQSLLGDDMKNRIVVRFNYPMEPYSAIGIVMDEFLIDGQEMYVVMMPLTMSAGTGVLLQMPKTRTTQLDVDATTALEHVITCGMVPLVEKSSAESEIVIDIEQFWKCIRYGQRRIRFKYSSPIDVAKESLSMRKKKSWYCHQMPTRRGRRNHYVISEWLKVRLYEHWYYHSQLRKYRCELEADGCTVCFTKGSFNR